VSTLQVYFRDEPCGLLFEYTQGQMGFCYLDSWIEGHGFPISTQLPLTKDEFGDKAVAPFLASFLPEGETVRSRLQHLLHVDASHDFGLLRALGRECAGALSFWPENEQPGFSTAGYLPLGDDEFSRWKEFAHQLPLQFPGREIRLSLAGAQSKTALYFDAEGNAFLPEHGASTSHILKPAIPGCRPNSAFVELITVRLARAVLGDERVPESDLWHSCYRVQRFDRPRTATGVSRLHQEDFCSALGRMPFEKYENVNKPERLMATCFELIDHLGRQGRLHSPAVERMRLLDQVIVNVLLHNPDAHLKNYALLYAEDGMLEVAPLYDCLSTASLAFRPVNPTGWEGGQGTELHTRQLSLQIGSAGQIDKVGIGAWEELAEECGFTRAYARRRVKQLAQSVAEQMDAVMVALANEVPVVEETFTVVKPGITPQLNRILGTKAG